MRRYALNHWSIRLARLAIRFERATDRALQWVNNEDFACYHFEGRSLTWHEEIPVWWSGFKEGWRTAGGDGDPWFKLAEQLEAPTVEADR